MHLGNPDALEFIGRVMKIEWIVGSAVGLEPTYSTARLKLEVLFPYIDHAHYLV